MTFKITLREYILLALLAQPRQATFIPHSYSVYCYDVWNVISVNAQTLVLCTVGLHSSSLANTDVM